MELLDLPIENMADRHWGLTPALAQSYLEAARVILDLFHESPQRFRFDNNRTEHYALVTWMASDERCRGAWANKDDATRDGAYLFAIAASELALGWYAVRRAETRTGADYYLAPLGHPAEDLEDTFRLEVSGTRLDEAEVRKRLQEKGKQAKGGKSNLPAIAVVVGFQVKLMLLQAVEQ